MSQVFALDRVVLRTWLYEDKSIQLVYQSQRLNFVVSKLLAQSAALSHEIDMGGRSVEQVYRALLNTDVVLGPEGAPFPIVIHRIEEWPSCQTESGSVIDLYERGEELIFRLYHPKSQTSSSIPVNLNRPDVADYFLNRVYHHYLINYRLTVFQDGAGRLRDIFFCVLGSPAAVYQTWFWNDRKIQLVLYESTLHLLVSNIGVESPFCSLALDERHVDLVTQFGNFNRCFVRYDIYGNFHIEPVVRYSNWPQTNETSEGSLALVKIGTQVAWLLENRNGRTLSRLFADVTQEPLLSILRSPGVEEEIRNFTFSASCDSYGRLIKVSIVKKSFISLDSESRFDRTTAAVTLFCSKRSKRRGDSKGKGHAMLAVERMVSGFYKKEFVHITIKPMEPRFVEKAPGSAEIEIIRDHEIEIAIRGPTWIISKEKVERWLHKIEERARKAPVPFNMTGNPFFSGTAWKKGWENTTTEFQTFCKWLVKPKKSYNLPPHPEGESRVDQEWAVCRDKIKGKSAGKEGLKSEPEEDAREYNCLVWIIEQMRDELDIVLPKWSGWFAEPRHYITSANKRLGNTSQEEG